MTIQFQNLFLLVGLQLEREGALALDDPQGSLRKRKEEILPLIAPPVRKKGRDNAIFYKSMSNFFPQ